MADDRELCIEKELELLPTRIHTVGDGCCKLIACVPAMVRVSVHRTAHKNMDLVFQFPDDYPDDLILIEMKSKVLPEKFLDSFVKAVELKKEDFVGRAQILPVAKFAVEFLDQNPLCVCAGEISNVRKTLTDCDSLKIKQKLRTVVLSVAKDEYRGEFKLMVPENYPDAKVDIEMKLCNFPRHFIKFLNGQAAEIARQCVEKPLLRKTKKNPNPQPLGPFVPQKSLQPVIEFLIENIRRYPVEKCPICKKRAFPPDPSEITENSKDPLFIDRVYCTHIYHYSCLDRFMTTPPFKGGKKCLVCQQLIFHDKWRESDQMREDRWAHEQARIREIDEVTEFLK